MGLILQNLVLRYSGTGDMQRNFDQQCLSQPLLGIRVVLRERAVMISYGPPITDKLHRTRVTCIYLFLSEYFEPNQFTQVH